MFSQIGGLFCLSGSSRTSSYIIFYLLVPQGLKWGRGLNVIDLGCGTGHLTKVLHDSLRSKKTLGIDSSEAMLKDSVSIKSPNLDFQLMKIEDLAPDQKFDLIFSNAALQWLPDHHLLFGNLAKHLTDKGQLAIQMPSNFDYPTHTIAKELGMESPFKESLVEGRLPSVLKIEDYANILHQLGFKKQIVRLQIYPHVLESTESLIEWVKGSLLTYYQSRLSPDNYEQFLIRYREKVLQSLGNTNPFFMPFKRLILWAQY